jgi:tetratricopeptide (TPR) repeat protein
MNIKELTKLANDAYYAAEYAKAIQLYRQILEQAPKNNNARIKLAKAERSLSLGTTIPEVPIEAIQLYKRSRSFITAGDLPQAKKLLEKAISIAKKTGAEFLTAQDLLENLSNALAAEEYKKRAFEAIDAKLWLKADAELNSATKLDPTDEIVQTLSSHLGSLLKAQRLISRLEADIETARKRSEIIKEIRQIIDITNETTTLSTLWQDVVRLFGEYNNRNIVFRNRNIVFRWVMIACLFTSAMLLITFGSLYLYPRHRSIDIVCDSIASGLHAELEYPYYIANGDVDNIEITFINDSKSVIDDRLIAVKFTGTANIKYVDTTNSNEIKLNDLNPDKDQPEKIPFFVDGSTNRISGPWYINFSVGACTPKDFHIAMTPISSLRKIVTALWGIVAATLIALLKDRIKELFDWVLLFFKGNNN